MNNQGSSAYEKIAGLPIVVERYQPELLSRDVSSGFTRFSNVIKLSGGGRTGEGEDVTYEKDDQIGFNEAGTMHDLSFDGTFAEFSEKLGTLDFFPKPPGWDVYRNYRRWGFESAALDLALRQANTSLDQLLGVEYRPVRFVVSLRLGDPARLERVTDWLALQPGLEFKLDAQSNWTRELIEQLAATGSVESVDLKGMYEGTEVDQGADARLYKDVVEVFDKAWLEDPAFTDETRPILIDAIERITWDAPIHSVNDIEQLEFKPRGLNIKPSRFGSLEALIAGIDYCDREGITMYGGGQFELGIGRQQLHALASIFFPDGPNDVAPMAYNLPEPSEGAQSSPLTPPAEPVGFSWRAA